MSILEKIYTSTQRFLVPLDVNETYKIIVDEAIKLVDGRHGSILLKSNSSLERVYATSPLLYSIKPRSKGIRYNAFKKRKALILHTRRVKKLAKTYPALDEMNGKSVILIPLSNYGKPIGLLTVNSSKDRYFRKKDLETLKIFGSLASIAIRKAQLYDEVKDALSNRDMFISLAAHELRTPLTSVLGYLQLLKSNIERKKIIPSKWLEELDLESKRLKQVVEEFLEINRIRTGKFQYDFKEIRIKSVINRAISSFKFSWPKRRLIFKGRLTPRADKIIGDRDKLIQVITNILENAAKYSPQATEIIVTLKLKSPFYILEVIDKGQGIPKEEIPFIFKGFYKGKNSMNEGMGLGLYLSKSVIEDHKGSIYIDSELNKGTRVQIKLPEI